MSFRSANKQETADGDAVAHYIASLADELARLAESHDLEELAYILDMARIEAEEISKRWSGPDSAP
jgi:hypothetical protein